jgi:cytidylate kinase
VTDHVIAIDGPAGSGKSSVSRKVAAALNWVMLDTGAMYRAITCAVLEAGVTPEDSAKVAEIAKLVGVRVDTDPNVSTVFLNGVDVTNEIRSTEVTAAVSAVSAVIAVRERLVELQRETVSKSQHGIVIEGRDIGSVVLPDAKLKIYLTADPRVRAFRRSSERGNTVTEADLDAMQANIMERDSRDSSRDISPLQVATDAVVIDTSHMSLGQVVDAVTDLAREVYPNL